MAATASDARCATASLPTNGACTRIAGALLSPYCAAGRRARLDVCECRICHPPSARLIRT